MSESSNTEAQRFDEVSPQPLPPRIPLATIAMGAAGISVALAVAVVLMHPPLVIALAVGLVLAVVASLVTWRLGRPRPPSGPRRGLTLRDRELLFDPGDRGAKAEVVARLTGRFGVTLLANRARTRVVMVVTTTESTFYVGAQADEAHRAESRQLLASAYTVASDERALEAAGPDGSALLLSLESLERLHAALLAIDPGCGGRVLLTDVRGEPVVLDGARLQVGRRSFDLQSSLEWRGMLFRESGLGGLAVYQGTHVRQGSTEVVFVSLMPALSAPSSPGDMLSTAEPSLERAVLRDMALLHESAEDPPPADLRVAIDRVFMLPLRAALNATRQRPSQPDPASSKGAARSLRA